MFDFFDEDFPLSKKQEEELKKRLAAEEEHDRAREIGGADDDLRDAVCHRQRKSREAGVEHEQKRP